MCLEPPFLQNTSALDPCKCMALLRKADLEAKCVRPCLAKQIWKENIQNWVLPMSSQGPNQLCLRVGEMEACLGKIASGTNLTWKKLFTCPRRNFPGVLSRALWIKLPPHLFSAKISRTRRFCGTLTRKKRYPKKALVHCCWRRVRFNTALELFFILLGFLFVNILKKKIKHLICCFQFFFKKYTFE